MSVFFETDADDGAGFVGELLDANLLRPQRGQQRRPFRGRGQRLVQHFFYLVFGFIGPFQKLRVLLLDAQPLGRGQLVPLNQVGERRLRPQKAIAVADGVPVVGHPVGNDVDVLVAGPVAVPDDGVLRAGQLHLLHVVLRYLAHLLARQFRRVVGVKAERSMPHGLAQFGVQLAAQIEVGHQVGHGVRAHAGRTQQLRLLVGFLALVPLHQVARQPPEAAADDRPANHRRPPCRCRYRARR